jgi:hypothetical protein
VPLSTAVTLRATTGATSKTVILTVTP